MRVVPSIPLFFTLVIIPITSLPSSTALILPAEKRLIAPVSDLFTIPF
jgi:hypothetical protein